MEFKPRKSIAKRRIVITLFVRQRGTDLYDYKVVMRDLITDKIQADEEFDSEAEAIEYFSNLYDSL